MGQKVSPIGMRVADIWNVTAYQVRQHAEETEYYPCGGDHEIGVAAA